MSPGVAILDLIESDLDGESWSGGPTDKAKKEEPSVDEEILELALHEFKKADKPQDGLEALRVLLNLMK